MQKYSFVSVLLLFTVLACNSSNQIKRVTQEEKTLAMSLAHFDKRVIKDLKCYEALKDLVLRQKDSIFANQYNYFNIVIQFCTVKDPKNPSNCILDVSGNCDQMLMFFETSQFKGFKLPPSLDTLQKEMQRDDISGIIVSKNNRVEIVIPNESPNVSLYLGVSHSLIWNSLTYRDDRYADNRDSIISPNCFYRIALSERYPSTNND